MLTDFILKLELISSNLNAEVSSSAPSISITTKMLLKRRRLQSEFIKYSQYKYVQERDIAREYKTITLQQFVPCLYTVSSGRPLQCTDTYPLGCYILCTVCSKYISILLLGIILVASMKYVQHRNFKCNIILWRVRIIFLPPTIS
jgi:hypothetical protein